MAINDTNSPDQKTVSLYHKKSDVDSSRAAQHHSIGTGIYQVASGKHNHRDDGALIFDPSTHIVTGARNLATGDLPGIVNQLLNILEAIGIENATTP